MKYIFSTKAKIENLFTLDIYSFVFMPLQIQLSRGEGKLIYRINPPPFFACSNIICLGSFYMFNNLRREMSVCLIEVVTGKHQKELGLLEC
jgi:hypothetical protein